MCVCVCVCARARACVRACVCVWCVVVCGGGGGVCGYEKYTNYPGQCPRLICNHLFLCQYDVWAVDCTCKK